LRHHLAVDQGADVPAALVEPSRRAVPELRVDVALSQIDRLHHVHFRVDQPEASFRHDPSSALPKRYQRRADASPQVDRGRPLPAHCRAS
jgi:hypothetical protein